MNFLLKLCLMISALSLIRSHTHDEISKCVLSGVYKMRQNIIKSPDYPNNYKPDTCWDYVIRSPFKCPTTFHIQFLDFYLEFSKDCQNDYLAIGLENVDDDMDVLCGQVVGIKKYHTPDGILHLRFFADQSSLTTGRGFKLLITRLACERDELSGKSEDQDDEGDANDTEDYDGLSLMAPSGNFQPPDPELMQIFRNLTGQEQYQIVNPPSSFALNYPTQLPSPPYPATGTLHYPGINIPNNFQQPCTNDKGQHYYGALAGNQLTTQYPSKFPGNVPASYLPFSIGSNSINQVQPAIVSSINGIFTNPRDQYISSWSTTANLPKASNNRLESLEDCCVSAFQQKHFYLSSPGFPRTIFSNILPNDQKRDCVFRVQKSSSNVCRLRLNFKFFDFGQIEQGSGSYVPNMQNRQNVCRDDFIKFDNQRFCGCRSGNTFTSYWITAADKKIRMRMGYSGIPSGGFLIELVQEECSETQFASITTEKPHDLTLTTNNPNILNDQLINTQQAQQNLYGSVYPNQQQNLNAGINQGQPFFIQNPLQQNSFLGQQQQQQQLVNTPGIISNHFQQHSPSFLSQQQHQHQLQYQPNNNFLNPSFGANYLSYLPLQTQQQLQQNLLQQQGLSTNPFALPQVRNTRSYNGDQQPISVVETNSTRKEYYFIDNESLNYKDDSSFASRSSSADWDRTDNNVNENNDLIDNIVRQGQKCSFDMGDILRLSVDILWITKPICYAPQRNWFTNWIG